MDEKTLSEANELKNYLTVLKNGSKVLADKKDLLTTLEVLSICSGTYWKNHTPIIEKLNPIVRDILANEILETEKRFNDL